MYFLGGGCGSFEMMSRHNFATFFVFWNYEGLIAWKGNYLVAHRQGFWIFFAFRSQVSYVHRTCIAKKEKEGKKYLSLLGVSLWHWARVQTPKISLFLLNYGGKISSYLKEKCSESVTSPRFPPLLFRKKKFRPLWWCFFYSLSPFRSRRRNIPSWLVFRPPLLFPLLSFPLAALRRWSKTHPPFPFPLFKKRKMRDRKRKRKRWGIRPLTLAEKKVAQSAKMAIFLHCKNSKIVTQN